MASKKHTVITRPSARAAELLVQHVESETVVFDERTKTAHALRPLAAAVFMYADGNNTIEEIAELASYRLATEVSAADVTEAVAQLEESDLLETPTGLLSEGISRRTALKTFAAAGAGTMLVSSIAAPFASASNLSNAGIPYVCAYVSGGPYITGSGHSSGSDPIVGSVGGIHAPSRWPIPYTSVGGGQWAMVAGNNPGAPVTADDYNLGSNCIAAKGSTWTVYGTYQVVPCDGATWACANVVCVPTNTGKKVGTTGTSASVISGAITSGAIYDPGANFAAPSGVQGTGYGPYTDYAYGPGSGYNYFFKICCADGGATNCKHS